MQETMANYGIYWQQNGDSMPCGLLVQNLKKVHKIGTMPMILHCYAHSAIIVITEVVLTNLLVFELRSQLGEPKYVLCGCDTHLVGSRFSQRLPNNGGLPSMLLGWSIIESEGCPSPHIYLLWTLNWHNTQLHTLYIVVYPHFNLNGHHYYFDTHHLQTQH